MNITTVAVATAVVALLFGLATLLLPAEFLAIYGSPELSEQGLIIARSVGGLAIGFAIVDWFARDDLRGGVMPGARQGIVLANLAASAILAVLAVIAGLNAIFNELAWVNAGIFVVIAAGWAYYGMAERRSPG